MKKGILIILSSLFLFGTASAQRKGRDKIVISESDQTEPKDRAFDFYLNGKWSLSIEEDAAKAGKSFIAALACDSLYAPAHYELSKIMRSKSDAINHLLIANKQDSLNVEYLMQLGMLYADNENLDEAIVIAEKIKAIKPNNQKSYLFIATIHLMKKDFDNALKTLDTLSKRVGDSYESKDLKVEVLSNMEPNENVIKGIKSLIEDDSENSRLYVLLGNKYLQQRRDTLALEQYHKSLEVSPENIYALISMFDYYVAKRDKKMVMEVLPLITASTEIIKNAKKSIFRELIGNDEYYQHYHYFTLLNMTREMHAMYPDDFEITKLYTKQLVYLRDINKAKEVYQDAIDKGYGGVEAYHNIINISFYKKRLDSVAMYANAAMEKYPSSLQVMARISAQALLEGGESDKAITLLKSSIKKIEEDSIKSLFHSFIGDIENSNEEFTKAIRSYKKALSLNRNNIASLNNYAYLLAEQDKDLKKALKMARIVIEEEPSNVTYLDTYAWVLYKMGLYHEASEIMSKAIALDTTNNDVLLLHYGDILYMLDKKLLAERYWKKALEAGGSAEEIVKRVKRLK